MIESKADHQAIAQQLSAARKALDSAFFEMMACRLKQQLNASSNMASARTATAQMAKMLSKFG